MKKSILLLGLLLAMTSCAPKLAYVANLSYINYQTYADEDMYITESNSVNFNYTPLGSVSATVLSGYVKSTRPSKLGYNDIYGVAHNTEEYNKWQSADVNDAIALAVEKAKQQNGNGIINLKINLTSKSDGKTTRFGFIVTGMVIRK